eukprot:scaffold43369_cov19-Tisochrysis_lutea.AAC.1
MLCAFSHTCSQDGFTHLTADPNLLLKVANHFYKDTQGDWLLIILDPGKLASKVVFEPAAPVGQKSQSGLDASGEGKREDSGPLFPHLVRMTRTMGCFALMETSSAPWIKLQVTKHLQWIQGKHLQTFGEAFPFALYGPINHEAVVSELPVQRAPEDGNLDGLGRQTMVSTTITICFIHFLAVLQDRIRLTMQGWLVIKMTVTQPHPME